MTDNDEYLTILKACQVLPIGRNKMYELVKSGRIQSFREGKKILIPRICLTPEYLLPLKKHESQELAGV